MSTGLRCRVGVLLMMALCTATTVAAGAAPTGDVRFCPAVVNDAELQGVAYRLLVPQGWSVDGGIRWDVSSAAAPAMLSLRVASPGGSAEFTCFPSVFCTWSPTIGQYFPEGHRTNEGMEVRRAPDGPVAALANFAVQRCRPAAARGARLLAAEELPLVARAMAELYPPGGSVRVARVRVQYDDASAGRTGAVEEEFVGTLLRVDGAGGTVWGVDHLMSYRADAGTLDGRMPALRTVAASLRPDPRWYEAAEQVMNALVQMQFRNQEALMERFRIRTEAGHQISDITMRAWRSKTAAMDRAHENYDQKAIRGVESRVNPFSGEAEEASSAYAHVWETENGDRIYSNDAAFNPNVGSNLAWKEARRR